MASTVHRMVNVVTHMHTDEPGDEVNELLRRARILGRGVRLITREVPDWARDLRGLDCNPASRASGFSGGNRDDQFLHEVYEASREADVTLDVHFNRNRWSFPFMSLASWWGSPLLRGVASQLGSDWIVINRGAHPSCFIQRCVGFDIGTDSLFREGFVDLLERLVSGWLPPERALTPYLFVGDVLSAQAEKFDLSREYSPLDLLPHGLAQELGSQAPLHVALWGPDLYPSEGFWGEVVTPRPHPVLAVRRPRPKARRQPRVSWGGACP